MLDQLVAFCGEKIGENDVLNIFGFTSEQTVADLTGRILHGETPAALELLYEQSESGKDMMRLMSDLIVYLRDLLVFKAKPDAVKEDVDPDLQKSLTAHAGLIATDRLLELIDQFAAAEARMKWVPNKKLHFEVALIKAIQTLNQVTLNDVIENLTALRDGKETPTVSRGAKPVASVAPEKPAPRAAEQPEPGSGVPQSSAAPVDANATWRQTL